MQVLIFFIGVGVGILIGIFVVGILWAQDKYEKPRKYPLTVPVAHARFETGAGKVTRIYEYRHATAAQMTRIADHIGTNGSVTMAFLERLKGNRPSAILLRDELMDAHILRWRNIQAHKEGMIPTTKGIALFRELANNASLSRYLMSNDELQNVRRTHRVQSLDLDEEEQE